MGELPNHFILLALAITPLAHADRRLVSIADRRLSIECTGAPSPHTVILIAGQGRTMQDWSRVQPALSGFTRVCSYDRAGFGESDKPPNQQSMAEIVDDLHQLLAAAHEKPPYILVGHSIAGIICRRFTAKFPADVSGLLFLDSSHEEQIWRLHEIDSNGPSPDGNSDVFYGTGRRLDWHTNAPLIVITQGKPGPPLPGLTPEQNAGFARVWQELQQDLAARSPRGQFRVAEQSGHFIQLDEPDLVVQSIKDLLTGLPRSHAGRGPALRRW
jgi:pimeloyl-ACP methyl ester carboxylesterase